MKTTSHYTASFIAFNETAAVKASTVVSPSKWLNLAIEKITGQVGLTSTQQTRMLNCLTLVQVNFDNTAAKRKANPSLAAGLVAFDLHTQLQTLSAVRAMIMDYAVEQGIADLDLPKLPRH